MRPTTWLSTIPLGALGAWLGAVLASRQRWLAPVKDTPPPGEVNTLELPAASGWGLAAGAVVGALLLIGVGLVASSLLRTRRR